MSVNRRDQGMNVHCCIQRAGTQRQGELVNGQIYFGTFRMAEMREGKRSNIEFVFCFWNLGHLVLNLALLLPVSVWMKENH